MSILRTVLAIFFLALAVPVAAAPVPAAETSSSSDKLFDALASAANALEAREIELRIFAEWAHTESPSAALLFEQALELLAERDHVRAREKLDVLTEIAPGFVEAWSFRALTNHELGNYARAVADLKRTLEIEPRHFRALALLGSILDELDDAKGALKAYRAAVDINPHLEGGAAAVRRLTEKVKGRGI